MSVVQENERSCRIMMEEERSLKMEVGSYYVPKENKNRPKGEDAHFFNKDYQTIGVADGVGGWAKKGIDAGEYARELMENCVLSLYIQDKESVNPRVVLEEAFWGTTALGSSTACIITLTQDNYLHAVNVGDSGFMLFRDEEMICKSQEQRSVFNCPFQLGRSSEGCNNPSSAEEIKVAVKAGDIVVVGTDGLFDNMFESEIKDIICDKKKQERLGQEEFAWILGLMAACNSVDGERDTPFAQAKRLAGLGNAIGGKVDDITVLVARILPA